MITKVNYITGLDTAVSAGGDTLAKTDATGASNLSAQRALIRNQTALPYHSGITKNFTLRVGLYFAPKDLSNESLTGVAFGSVSSGFFVFAGYNAATGKIEMGIIDAATRAYTVNSTGIGAAPGYQELIVDGSYNPGTSTLSLTIYNRAGIALLFLGRAFNWTVGSLEILASVGSLDAGRVTGFALFEAVFALTPKNITLSSGSQGYDGAVSMALDFYDTEQILLTYTAGNQNVTQNPEPIIMTLDNRLSIGHVTIDGVLVRAGDMLQTAVPFSDKTYDIRAKSMATPTIAFGKSLSDRLFKTF